MSELLGVLRELDDRTARVPPEPLASQLTAWGLAHDAGIGPTTSLRAVLVWSRLHGLVGLEIAGNFASMGIDPGQVFEAQLGTLTL
jgi:Tetracyclin repressor-like, C-terminal domain